MKIREICMGQNGPYHIWEQDTEHNKREFQDFVNTENTLRREPQSINQAQASIPDTGQYNILQDINENIDRQNEEEERTGRRKESQRGPLQEFKEEQFPFRSKVGINWVSYRESVLKRLLYPWINQRQALTSMPVTYLVEDDAPSHQIVQRVDKVERAERVIITFNCPSKSPDLNQSEPIWSDEKDEIATYQLTGVSQQTVEQAKAALEQVWHELTQALFDRKCATLHAKL